jgi:hypothetical protein
MSDSAPGRKHRDVELLLGVMESPPGDRQHSPSRFKYEFIMLAGLDFRRNSIPNTGDHNYNAQTMGLVMVTKDFRQIGLR